MLRFGNQTYIKPVINPFTYLNGILKGDMKNHIKFRKTIINFAPSSIDDLKHNSMLMSWTKSQFSHFDDKQKTKFMRHVKYVINPINHIVDTPLYLAGFSGSLYLLSILTQDFVKITYDHPERLYMIPIMFTGMYLVDLYYAINLKSSMKTKTVDEIVNDVKYILDN